VTPLEFRRDVCIGIRKLEGLPFRVV